LGGGYRFTGDNIFASTPGGLMGLGIRLVPQARTYSLFSTFVQDEISLSDKLSLTAGSKFEHNAFTGFEYELSARLAWTLTDSSTLWTAASRAARQPSRMETALNLQYPATPIAPGFAIAEEELGSPHLQAETVLDYEAGYRRMISDRVSFDIATFYSLYDHLQSLGVTAPGLAATPTGIILNLPIVYQNGRQARDYGPKEL
jgi:iron complex outermembrane receptor protein